MLHLPLKKNFYPYVRCKMLPLFRPLALTTPTHILRRSGAWMNKVLASLGVEWICG